MVYAKVKTLTRKPGGNRDVAIKDKSGKSGGEIVLKYVDREGDRFRDVGGGDDGAGHASLHERCNSSFLFSSDAVTADPGVTRYLEGGVGPQPGFLDAEDRRRVPHLRDAVPQLCCAGPEAERVPLENLEINLCILTSSQHAYVY